MSKPKVFLLCRSHNYRQTRQTFFFPQLQVHTLQIQHRYSLNGDYTTKIRTLHKSLQITFALCHPVKPYISHKEALILIFVIQYFYIKCMC